jgi:peptide/nickel transport system substrate-binding protein
VAYSSGTGRRKRMPARRKAHASSSGRHMMSGRGGDATDPTRREILALAALGLMAAPGSVIAAGAETQLTWGIHVSLAPVWFDPADSSGIITPFMVLYALHDAMVKPMPGQLIAPSLAEAWSASEDGLSYEFALREGALFHNGDPVTA